ncbi:hypothetical protein MLD38_014023 [Melastoma candidum]|uniref:Uncharacterized protein n=1 Tax=Melastoma candidum TaxID=119954 RepID=A0ACB9RCK8_9MYRT|nr:hypothetical protein MLD38_014023 [Melastoma candidum]
MFPSSTELPSKVLTHMLPFGMCTTNQPKRSHNIPYIALLPRCSTLRHLKQVHAQTVVAGLFRFAFTAGKVLSFAALSNYADMAYAEAIFDHTPSPDVFQFNVMMMGLSKDPRSARTVFTYRDMIREGIGPNSRTFAALSKACGCSAVLGQVHCHVMKFGFDRDVYTVSSLMNAYFGVGSTEDAVSLFNESSTKNVVCWTCLISGYCSAGLVDEARRVFDEMPLRNDVSYSAMVSGYVNNGRFNEAIELFRGVKGATTVRLSESLLVGVLNACTAVGALEEGRWVHSYMERNGIGYELELGTALIVFYGKCGFTEAAREVFCKMHVKDVSTWSALILGLGINGLSDEALETFRQMEENGPEPNAVTFVAALVACNTTNLIDESWRLFGLMTERYDIAPTIEHYGCMVDLLARAGKIEEAYALLNRMPVKPDGTILGSMLNGCLLHGYIELGKEFGRLSIEMEPKHSGRYVLLSNIHASMGCWEDVIQLRRRIKIDGVLPAVAWSFIEIDGLVHRFVVGDKSHPCLGSITEVLNNLTTELICLFDAAMTS